MRNARVTSYIPPTYTALQTGGTNKLFWVLKGIGMSTVGEFTLFESRDRTDYPAIRAHFAASLEDLNMQVTVNIGRSMKRTIKLTVEGCNAQILGPVQVQLNDEDPAINETLAIMSPLIQDEFRRVFAEQLCEIGTQFVETELSNLMDEYTSKLSFGKELQFPSFKERFLSFIFPWEQMENFIIDSKLTGEPIVTQQYLETHHDGRIYHNTDRPEYFPLAIRPERIPAMPFQSTNMLQVQVSDYSINSFLISAHADITHKTHPTLRQYLNLKCGRHCIGAIFPVLNDKYPKPNQKYAEISVKTTRPPEFKFQRDGFVAFSLEGSLVLRVPMGVPNQRGGEVKDNVLLANFVVLSRASVALVRDKIRGKVRIDGVNLNIQQSTIDVSEGAKQKLIELSTTVFEQLINTDLANGLPIPLIDSVSLYNTTIEVQERRVLITTDFFLDKETVKNLVFSAVNRHFLGTAS